MADVRAAVDRVWRSDAAGMLGVLTRRLGDLGRAEDALQDALAEALRRWAVDGVPERPAGWLVTTAWRRALDGLRRDTTGREKLATLAAAPEVDAPTDEDRLALIFGCCHPALAHSAQVPLTLRAVCGLSTEEIAAAYLVPVATIAQRLVRAKRALAERGVPFDLPDPDEYPTRLTAVLAVVYLVFNEGYLASGSTTPQRRELAREALALARQLTLLMPGEPEVAGLTALLELNEARAATRFDSWGRLVLLEDQDRSRWDLPAMEAAVQRLGRAVAQGRPGRYQLEAGIAAQHALASSYQRTPWAAIRVLYDALYQVAPSPVVLLSRAVATQHVHGAEAALAEVDALGDRLGGYRLFHATRAELLRACGRTDDAREATRRALALASNPAERELLARRLAS
ncbi:MAG: RNA polymerase subunit sigma-24 [Actinobacteria bacterium 13_2_20CM_2_71_6]|nr:MAG: RNA polymerase subunit sigma-24 [Actinobacteria bacterium 13_2_20CM_2_71_6]